MMEVVAAARSNHVFQCLPRLRSSRARQIPRRISAPSSKSSAGSLDQSTSTPGLAHAKVTESQSAFIQSGPREWAYATSYPFPEGREAELPSWLHRYFPASPTRQPGIHATHQSPATAIEQAVEASHLGRFGLMLLDDLVGKVAAQLGEVIEFRLVAREALAHRP